MAIVTIPLLAVVALPIAPSPKTVTAERTGCKFCKFTIQNTEKLGHQKEIQCTLVFLKWNMFLQCV